MTEASAKLVANVVCVILYKPGEFVGDQRTYTRRDKKRRVVRRRKMTERVAKAHCPPKAGMISPGRGNFSGDKRTYTRRDKNHRVKPHSDEGRLRKDELQNDGEIKSKGDETMKLYKNGEYIEVEDALSGAENEFIQTAPEAAEPTVSIENALRDTMTAIASSDTNSIAKIRAAAQQFLDTIGGDAP